MFAMAGLGLCDMVDEDTFQVNDITKHMVDVPSSIHGMLHLSVTHVVESNNSDLDQYNGTHVRCSLLDAPAPRYQF